MAEDQPIPGTSANSDPFINAASMEELRELIGTDVRLRSKSAYIDGLIERDSDIIEIKAQDYDKGFDRTNPGYDRTYDRDAGGDDVEGDSPRPGPHDPAEPGYDRELQP